MDITDLEAEAQRLELPAFTEETALALGLALVETARAGALPVVIDIRTADRTLFHVALPGASPSNDSWARRKSNVALMFHQSSLLVGMQHEAQGRSLAIHGLPAADYADHGGAVPIRVRGVGVVAVATVSGLPAVEDHKLVVRAIESLL